MISSRYPDATLEDGMHLFGLRNDHELEAKILTYGAVLMSLSVPNSSGECADIVLGFDSPSDYVSNPPYFGATIGRFANRIGNARFTLDGLTYSLTRNEGAHHLHGGRRGFDKVVWSATMIRRATLCGVRLEYESKDGEEGYPGHLSCTTSYVLTDQDELRCEYRARTTRATPVSLTNHSYFNLEGHAAGSVLNHVIQIPADRYVETDEEMIPTGRLLPVKDTPLDLTQPSHLRSVFAQLPGGLDHTYVPGPPSKTPRYAASMVSPTTGRTLDLYTTYPCVQIYTANHLDGRVVGKGGTRYTRHGGLCLEAQNLPDAPNQPGFPSAVLAPGEIYHHTTVYRFGVVRSS